MKKELIEKMESLKQSLSLLNRDIKASKPETVSKIALRQAADNIATKWVEEIRSPLEHKFKIDKDVIAETSELMKKLHILSRPNNLKSSYIRCINKILKGYDDKLILPIKQTAIEIKEIFDLKKLIPSLPDPDESEYLKEAIDCAQSGFHKASIVMGWCAVINRIQIKILSVGFNTFNTTSTKLKSRKSGKFKKWNKEFSISSLSELQTVFDKDLIVVIEGMDLLEGNQSERLSTCFQYRNHCAHPGEAPIEPIHVVTFFTDINRIILQNPKFTI